MFISFCKIVKNEKKEVIQFIALELIMEKNLKILVLMHIVMKMKLFITSLLLELLNKNGVVERKNRTLKEMTRTMLCENNL